MKHETPLEISWLHAPEDAAELHEEWEALVCRTGADIWFTPAWVTAWWKHYGARRRPLFLCARRGGQLVGLLPFALETFRFAGLPLRLARLAGPHPLFAILALPVAPGSLEDVVSAGLTDLVERFGCDGISLSPFSAASGDLANIRAATGRSPALDLHDDSDPGQHTIIRLPESFDAYMAGLSRNRRSKRRKTKRVLEEEHGVATEVLRGSETSEELETFVAMHTRQWQRKDRLGHFADWPGSTGFFAEACRRMAASGRARLYLQKDPTGHIVAALFCFVSGATCHALLPARDDAADVAALNVGLHAQFDRIEHLIGEGVKIIDSGRGEYDYKQSLNGESVALHRVLVRRAGARSRLAMRLLLAWADLLNLVYYRIWFLKIAPRARRHGLKTRPLWQAWIRTRI